MTSVVTRSVFWRACAAVSFFVAFATGVLCARALPLPQGPPFGGSWHVPIALFVSGGLPTGMAFFRSRWAQAQAFAGAIALALFEFSFTLARLPASPAASWTASLGLGVGGGLIFFLCALPDLLAPRKDSTA